MTSREKFEAWYLENWGHTEDDHETLFERDSDSDEEYYRLGVRMAHGAWQASEEDTAVQLANAERKCRELAGENAGLKNPENWLSQSDYGYEASEVATQNGATEDESLRAGMIAIINRIGTPATDAFLAEVRASALEYYANLFKDTVNMDLKHNQEFHKGTLYVADQFRKGVQS
ncbi:hypothetical protein [Citrobacter freundii]|uniref:hypothetical protein n=1 Tax=Citrobacter freundii TaxID=546 RepID=UPI001D119501|nr:hypothetical protein [Citrobacter freundii]MCC2939175.1 hypothetical protein [Citrobacter freundii]